MGSYLYTGDVRFHLPKEQIRRAFHAVESALERADPPFDGENAAHAKAYLADPATWQETVHTALKTVVELLGWSMFDDEQGNITDITPESDVPCYEEALFTLLGPYVSQGSFIEIEEQSHGNRDMYRYAFTGKRMIIQEMTYPSIPDED